MSSVRLEKELDCFVVVVAAMRWQELIQNETRMRAAMECRCRGVIVREVIGKLGMVCMHAQMTVF